MTALPVEPESRVGVSRIRTLDGMRGIAALGVMWFHFASQFEAVKLPTKVLELLLVTGPRLELFFVLSGFLVTGILYDTKNRQHYYRNFYVRRMLRILPLYYGALTILFVMPYLVRAPGAAAFRAPLEDQLWYWFYLQNFNPLPPQFIGLGWHLWSLAIEQQFYLVWPIVIFKTSRMNALRVCGALVLVSIAYRFVGGYDGALRPYWPTPARLDGIAVGSALALIARGPHGLEALWRKLTPVFLMSVLYIAGFVLLERLRMDRAAMFPLYFTATAIFFGSLMVYAIFAGNGIGARVLRSRTLAFFGKYGYGLYVFHVPLVSIAALAGFHPRSFAGMRLETLYSIVYLVVLTGLTTAVALVSWNLWEKQFLKLKPVLLDRNRPERIGTSGFRLPAEKSDGRASSP